MVNDEAEVTNFTLCDDPTHQLLFHVSNMKVILTSRVAEQLIKICCKHIIVLLQKAAT